MSNFKLKSEFQPAGDQPQAIEKLVKGLEKGLRHQTLLGVTGSGKTFTMANVIAAVNKPTLVIAHNKTLAAQLAQEYRDFFPEAAVHYFVSYYDYYQPEAYLPTTDTYIEKDASINEEIDRLRHASTQALLTRQDVIIVASVSCIYGLGSPEEYQEENLFLHQGEKLNRTDFLKKLVKIHYTRTNGDLNPGTFRALGNNVEVMPPGEQIIFSFAFGTNQVETITKIDAVTRELRGEVKDVFLFPAKHFITSPAARDKAIKSIRAELAERLAYFEKQKLPLEAERIKRRTNYDLAMIKEIGYCSGIENYSRHLSGREAGSAPDTLLSYFPPGFLTIIDESHVTIPQIGGMYAGDQSRKQTLIDYGFRLPSARDNRPLKFDEFEQRVGQTIYTSATPSNYEREHSEPVRPDGRPGGQVVEQIIRPTGLVDPELSIRPVTAKGNYSGQVQNFIAEAVTTIKKGDRVIATTLTKKMAEDLATYLKEKGIKAEYLHSEIKTLERIKILTAFRQGSAKGGFDCIVGVNLLREGLDLPEVSLIGILDADKEGFLRSEVSLIQTIGRAARNAEGRVILYADNLTGSLEAAIKETNRRREIQLEYNKKHGITPKTIIKNIKDITATLESERSKTVKNLAALDRRLFGKEGKTLKKLIKEKEKQMSAAVRDLDFETAALIRDEIKELLGDKKK